MLTLSNILFYIRNAISGITPADIGAQALNQRGQPNGYASLSATSTLDQTATHVPVAALTGAEPSGYVAMDPATDALHWRGNAPAVIRAAEQTAHKGIANGYCGLDANQRVAQANAPQIFVSAGNVGTGAPQGYPNTLGAWPSVVIIIPTSFPAGLAAGYDSSYTADFTDIIATVTAGVVYTVIAFV